jgi:hypothetical protein
MQLGSWCVRRLCPDGHVDRLCLVVILAFSFVACVLSDKDRLDNKYLTICRPVPLLRRSLLRLRV